MPKGRTMTGCEGRFAWVEIGRASPDAGAPWTAWMAPLPEDGALYRTLIADDGALTVAVDVQWHRGAEVCALHRGRRDLTLAADGRSIALRLLGAADEVTRVALARPNQGCGTTLVHGSEVRTHEALPVSRVMHRAVARPEAG